MKIWKKEIERKNTYTKDMPTRYKKKHEDKNPSPTSLVIIRIKTV